MFLAPNVGLFFWTLVVWLLVVFTLKKYAWEGILAFIEKHEQKYENAAKNAEKVQKQLDKVHERRDLIVAQAKATSDEIIKAANATREALIQEGRFEGEKERKRLIARGQQLLEQEHQKMLTSLEGEVATLALQIAEKVLEKEYTNRALVDQYVSEIFNKKKATQTQ